MSDAGEQKGKWVNLIPVTLKQANDFVKAYHRHHGPVTGWKFGVGLEHEGQLAGVGIASRPVSRMTQKKEPQTIEITRVCTRGLRNAPSMLYGALSRASFALGYNRVISKILCTETGHSLKCAGWKCIGESAGGSWSRPSRKRIDKHPTGKKSNWELRAGEQNQRSKTHECDTRQAARQTEVAMER
jgi:hypothetical protein